jgi:hypothetical protein
MAVRGLGRAGAIAVRRANGRPSAVGREGDGVLAGRICGARLIDRELVETGLVDRGSVDGGIASPGSRGVFPVGLQHPVIVRKELQPLSRARTGDGEWREHEQRAELRESAPAHRSAECHFAPVSQQDDSR